MTVQFLPSDVCSRFMEVSSEEGVVTNIEVIGGCGGNIQGIINLVVGMPVEQAIEKLSGIDCGGRGTSCPDQLSLAMKQLQEMENQAEVE